MKDETNKGRDGERERRIGQRMRERGRVGSRKFARELVTGGDFREGRA